MSAFRVLYNLEVALYYCNSIKMQKPSVHVIAAAFATNITFEIVKSH
jgi:hypothetical protein